MALPRTQSASGERLGQGNPLSISPRISGGTFEIASTVSREAGLKALAAGANGVGEDVEVSLGVGFADDRPHSLGMGSGMSGGAKSRINVTTHKA